MNDCVSVAVQVDRIIDVAEKFLDRLKTEEFLQLQVHIRRPAQPILHLSQQI